MKTLIVVACLLLPVSGWAQEKHHAANPTSEASVLEAKVRKVWADFKSKQRDSVAAVLADGFQEVEEGSNGFGDQKAELAMVDEFELSTFTLRDFAVKPLGKDAALVNYLAHYEGKVDGKPINSDTAYGEVWLHQGNDWKLFYAQETSVK
jgi:hypothetical protein